MSVPQVIGEPRTATVTQNPGAQPTRFRWFSLGLITWFILGLITLIMLVEALQHASFGIAGKAIQEEFQFTCNGWGSFSAPLDWVRLCSKFLGDLRATVMCSGAF